MHEGAGMMFRPFVVSASAAKLMVSVMLAPFRCGSDGLYDSTRVFSFARRSHTESGRPVLLV
ncbi:hypothetical protein CTI14_17125 [Methylobacterium radiotolerans]|nr:hypothetical protein CTI14_17125 [Methylobacterium radiotolerans]